MVLSPRILVLRGGALGDFVVTLPVFSALREQWPEAHIEVAGYPRIANLALDAGLIQAVRSLDDGAFARLFAYKGELSEDFSAYLCSFDIVLTFLHDPDALVEGHLKAIGVKQVITTSPLLDSLHACDHLVKGLEPLAIYAQGGVPMHPRTASEEAGRVVFHPGSGSSKKNWPLARYLGLADTLTQRGMTVSFLLGEAEHALHQEVSDSPFELFSGLSLPQAVECLSSASVYVGNDSGISHVAAALGLKCLVLFGPSDAALWGPRGAQAKLLRASGDQIDAISIQEVMAELEGFDL